MPSFDWRRVVGLVGYKDAQQGSTGLGPDFPDSAGDRERAKFRPSQWPRLDQVAVSDDDGNRIGVGSEGLLTRLDQRLADIEQQLLLERFTPQDVRIRDVVTSSDFQLRSTPWIPIPGITTQTTAYAAADAVGFPFKIAMGGPNQLAVIHDIMFAYDAVPTTSVIGLRLIAFTSSIANGTDNSKLTLSNSELLTTAGLITPAGGGADTIWTNNALCGTANSVVTQGRLIPTALNGDLWFQGYCNTAFTIASGGNIYAKFLYRYGNYVGVA